MDEEQAREILRTLANGIDPVTGEVLPDESPYNQPAVIRALFQMVNTMDGRSPSPKAKKSARSIEERQQENVRAGRPRNAGLPWNDASRAELASGYRAGTNVDQLSRDFERTRGAVISELVRQGFIEETKV